jgi:hypothetical protein
MSSGGTSPVAKTAWQSASPARTVVLADSFYWEAFSRFGAALVTRGFSVARYTGYPKDLPNKLQLRLQRLLFSELEYLPNTADNGAGIDLLLGKDRDPGTVVVEASDDLAAAMLTTGAGTASRRCSASVSESLLYDKLEMTGFVRALGVGVPRSWSNLLDVGHRGRVVVKHRLGFGGHGVRIVAASVDAVRQAQVGMSEQAESVFLQELVEGETVHLGGVAKDGQIYVSAAYRSRSNRSDDLGPSTSIQIIEDSALSENGARIVAALGYSGSFGMDFARNAEGEPLFLDFNSRIFGSWIGLQRAGLDFIGAYLTAYGLSDHFDRGPARVGTVCSVQPTTAVLIAGSPFIRTFAQSVRQSLAERRFLGTRWLTVALIESLCAAMIRGLRTVPHIVTRASKPVQ